MDSVCDSSIFATVYMLSQPFSFFEHIHAYVVVIDIERCISNKRLLFIISINIIPYLVLMYKSYINIFATFFSIGI